MPKLVEEIGKGRFPKVLFDRIPLRDCFGVEIKNQAGERCGRGAKFCKALYESGNKVSRYL